jgi:ATP-dependent RNA circularization protein (DNA/RNA ligase family)
MGEQAQGRMTDFFRFPHTPHLVWLGAGEPRDDKVLSPAEVRELLAAPVLVEEKLDGANLGLSVSPEGVLRAQNRGQYLLTPYAGQFARLGDWLALREEVLFDALGEGLLAFGEWCAARHSFAYDALPDWFLLFDIYDRSAGRFWSSRRRDAWATSVGLASVPSLLRGQTDMQALRQMVETRPSGYRDGPLEGIVARREDDDWLLARAKLVRADFTQHIDTHWRSHVLTWNRVKSAQTHG